MPFHQDSLFLFKMIDDLSEEELKQLIKSKQLVENTLYLFENKNSVIHYACLYGNLDLVKKCVADSIDINLKGGKYGNTPIFFTIYNKNYQIMLFLLENGAKNLKNSLGQTAKEICIKLGNYHGMLLLDQFFDSENEVCAANEQPKDLNLINYLKMKPDLNQNSWKIKFILYCTFFLSFLYDQELYFIILIHFLFPEHMMKFRVAIKLNIFYMLWYCWLSLMDCFIYFVLSIIQIAIFIKITRKTQRNISSDTSHHLEAIKSAISNNKFNKDQFCYICVKNKETSTKHCFYCDICVKEFDHHCPCLDMCISRRNRRFYNFYLLYSTIIMTIFNLEQKRNTRSNGLLIFIVFVWFLRILSLIFSKRKIPHL